MQTASKHPAKKRVKFPPLTIERGIGMSQPVTAGQSGQLHPPVIPSGLKPVACMAAAA